MELGDHGAPVLLGFYSVALGGPMLLAVCADEFLHGRGHPRVERAAHVGARGRWLEREVQVRVNGKVICLHDLEFVYKVNGFWIAENVVPPGLRSPHSTSGSIGLTAIPVGLGSEVGPATVFEELHQGFEVFRVAINVAHDAGGPQGLGIDLVNGAFKQAIGSLGEPGVLWPSGPSVNVVATEGRWMAYVDGVVVQSPGGNRGSELGGGGLDADDTLASPIDYTYSGQGLGGLGVKAPKDGASSLRVEGAHGLGPFRFGSGVFLDEEAAGLNGTHLAQMRDEAGDVPYTECVAISDVGWNDNVPDTGDGHG